MTTTVVNQYKESYDISIMCPGPWGNPYVIGRDGTREEVIVLFKHSLLSSTGLKWRWMRNNIHKLKDKRLGCCCKPHACHGDVLAELADGGEQKQKLTDQEIWDIARHNEARW